MNRRRFVERVAGATAISTLTGRMAVAQAGPPKFDPVEEDTASATPTIALNHLGFRPRARRKVLVVRATKQPAPAEYELRDLVPPFHIRRPLTRTETDLGTFLVADLSDLTRPGIYQITAGNERSVPFFIREDVWRRTLRRSVGYSAVRR